MFYENKEYEFIGKVESINSGEEFANVSLILEKNGHVNIKTSLEQIKFFQANKVYYTKAIARIQNEKTILVLDEVKSVYDYLTDLEELERVLKAFYEYAPVSPNELTDKIYRYIDSLTNETIKKIVSDIYKRYEQQFFIYPAATKFHHAYAGGLAYHTSTMLDMCEGFLKNYPFLNHDLLVAGVLLHDVSKTVEYSEALGAEYTTEGQLIGHICLAAMEINNTAHKLGLEHEEEALLLEHMVLASHGIPQYGSPKKPMVGEAFVLWTLDDVDSKMTVLGETLKDIEVGEFTQPIPVLERTKFYKHKLTNEKKD